jgi:hypothetical protein
MGLFFIDNDNSFSLITDEDKNIKVGSLMTMKSDGKASLCKNGDFPIGFVKMFQTTKFVQIVRTGKIGGFEDLIPGKVYYSGSCVPGKLSEIDNGYPVGLALSKHAIQIII